MAEDKGSIGFPKKSPEADSQAVLYPFVPGKYGLDLSKIKAGFIGEIETGSGRKVMGDFGQAEDKAWIRIDDVKDNYIMHLSVRGDTMSGDINTRKKSGESQPDFRAKHFIPWALNYFQQQGYPVRKIEARWADTRTTQWEASNFTKYWKLILAGAENSEAARQTWSGELFTKLGFTEVEEAVDDSEAVVTIFKKPELG